MITNIWTRDLSNYWTANLYFKARNGTYKRVPQVPNRDLFGDTYTKGTQGGFVVYYVSPGKSKVTAFKPVCAALISTIALANGSRVSVC
jgi:hypothetical protein